eukprot:1389349-Rhodomonas_salina.2
MERTRVAVEPRPKAAAFQCDPQLEPSKSIVDSDRLDGWQEGGGRRCSRECGRRHAPLEDSSKIICSLKKWAALIRCVKLCIPHRWLIRKGVLINVGCETQAFADVPLVPLVVLRLLWPKLTRVPTLFASRVLLYILVRLPPGPQRCPRLDSDSEAAQRASVLLHCPSPSTTPQSDLSTLDALIAHTLAAPSSPTLLLAAQACGLRLRRQHPHDLFQASHPSAP